MSQCTGFGGGAVRDRIGQTMTSVGKAIEAALEHVVIYPPSQSEKYPTIFALHGRGADANDLLPLVESLGRRDALLIAPRAPFRFNLGGGFAWYEMGQDWTPHSATFGKSLDLLRNFLGQVKVGYPVDPSRIVLLGFSQGTVMSYAAALLEPSSVQGLVTLSGYVPLRSGLPLKLDDVKGLPVFISHGTYDDLIPVKFGREASELLKKAGAEVSFHEYLMGHEVNEETIMDLARWFKKLW
jgi:phospholipase/carboxylesterase